MPGRKNAYKGWTPVELFTNKKDATKTASRVKNKTQDTKVMRLYGVLKRNKRH